MATKGLCKNGFNQARSCSNGQAAIDDSDDDWGPWAAPAPVEVVEVDDEKEDDTDEEEVLDYYERWDEDVEEEGADDGVEEVDDDEDEEDDEAKMEAAKVAARFAQSGDDAILDGLCNSLDDQFANRADVCPFHMTHWVPKGDAALAREQTGTGLKRRRGTSSRAGRVSPVNG